MLSVPETVSATTAPGSGIVVCCALVILALAVIPGSAFAQDEGFRPVRTDSPRQTFETFMYLTTELDLLIAEQGGLERGSDRTDVHHKWQLLREQAMFLIDASNVPHSQYEELASSTLSYLMDIFGRIDLPDLAAIPDIDGELPPIWRVPGTPLRIIQVQEGPRRGEYLFDQRSIRDAPRFYRGIQDLPLRSEAGVESWSRAIPQLTGPLIPSSLVAAIPAPMKRLWFDTAVWKIALVALLTFAAALFVRGLKRFLTARADRDTAAGLLLRSLTPLAILFLAKSFDPLVGGQINATGAFSRYYSIFLTAVNYIAAAWIFWLVARALFGWIAGSGNKDPESFDVQLRMIIGAIVAATGSVLILGAGAQALGMPVYSIVAGLGIGGLAVALAVRPTLENLISGIILFFDRPVSPGDFCTFGDQAGFVERIGIRTTKVRALDRTLMSVPNAKFVNMELTNWAYCDKMLIKTTIPLRNETKPDQLRHVLARIREMLHGHPRIENDTIRVRFSGYGKSSLDINLRIYALTQEWNAFFAIREDVFLRIIDIVSASGSEFAIPSQTLYMARDQGLDAAAAMAAMSEVRSWRESGNLPFPTLSAERVNEINDTLDWPPAGSADAGSGKDAPRVRAEHLADNDPVE